MPEMLRGHEFEALTCRFENQTELLHRMTVIDLQVFSGYISLQLALGAWLATHEHDLTGLVPRIGVIVAARYSTTTTRGARKSLRLCATATKR